MKILLIEDNPGDSRLFQEMLKEIDGNFQVKVAERLTQGLKFLASSDIDLVMLDLCLPDSNGLDTLSKLYDKHSHLPVVIMSSLSDKSLALNAVQLGAQDYLVKGSINAEILRRTIFYSIERKDIEQKLKEQNNIINAINRIFVNYLHYKTKEDLALLCLNIAEEITGSEISFIGEISPGSFFHNEVISDVGWKLCQIHDRKGHRKPPGSFKTNGLYEKVLRKGKAFMTNKPFSHPESAGTPKGHPAIKSFLGIPMISGGKTMGIIALANKKGGFKVKDVEIMEALSPTITEVLRYRQTEEDLMHTKNDLQLAQEVSNTGSWRLDLLKNKLYWSKECYKIFGISSDTPLDYKTFLLAVYPDDRDYVDREWKEALKGNPYDVVHRIAVGDKIKWIREKANLEYNRHELKGGFGIAQDITELKEAQKEISSLAKFPSEDPNPIFRVTDKLEIIYSNKPAQELLEKFGLKSFIIPKSLADSLEPSIRKKNKDGLMTLELDIGKLIYEFSIIPVKGTGYFNIYGKDITERKKAEKAKIKLLHNRIQNKEKRKLAEELHDTVTQTLFSSNLLSEAVSKGWEKNPQKALENLKKVRDLNRAAFLETRTILYELIPKKIAQESLADLIKSLVDAVILKFDIKFDIKFLGDYKLSYKVKHQVYRITQEAINNIVKHSKAKRAAIDCMVSPKELKLIISDDGIGFDIKNKSSKKNFGLDIMNKRAMTIGAKLDIVSNTRSGTRITLLKKRC